MLNYKYLQSLCEHRSGGFTLIDLMIVTAVVSMLTALAVSPYRDYTIRAKVADCMLAAAPIKLGISQYTSTVGNWPPDTDTASLSSNGVSEFCDGFVAYNPEAGSFQVAINEAAVFGAPGQLQPQLIPQINNVFTISWRCSRGATDESLVKYLPSACSGE